jgi:lipopolysaccharide transport system ATP-binding protein
LPAGNDESWFDPHLISQSRMEYEVDGARIIGLRITSSDRRQVNNIAHGNSYQFAYEVEFLNRFISIQFAMLIKTVNGVEIAGSHAFPPEEGIDVESGQRYFVRFPFEAVFLPGTYFCNAGVFTQKGDFKQPHRIIDSTAFRDMAGEAAVGRMGMVNAFMRSTNPPPMVLSDRAENVG